MGGKIGRTKYILALQGDQDQAAILKSARDYAHAKRVDPKDCFSTAWTDYVFTEFYKPTSTSLSSATEHDKLFIFGHGSPTGIAWMDGMKEAKAGEEAPQLLSRSRHANANALAAYLHSIGLRTMGLITFKACTVGINAFLTDLAKEFETRGIKVGWLKAYKGYASSISIDAEDVEESQPSSAPKADAWQFKPEYRQRLQEAAKTGTKLHEAIYPYHTKHTKADTDAVNAKIKSRDYRDAMHKDADRLKIVRGPGKLFEGQAFGEGDRFVGKGATGEVLFPPK